MRLIARSLLALTLLSASLLAQGPLNIAGAYFGNGNNFADVTGRVRSMVQGPGLNVPVSVQSMGIDPLPGVPKVLRVYYLINGQFNQGEWPENAMAQIGFGGPGGPPPNFGGNRRGRVLPLRIEHAVYGAGPQARDVTAMLQARVANNRLDLPVSNEALGGDPAVNQVKQLQITYEWAGQVFEVTANEHDMLQLPDGVNAGAAPARLHILSARWGFNNRIMDVTSLLQRNVQGDRLAIPASNNAMGGDPAQGADKQLIVVYEINGERGERRVNEGQQLVIP